MHELQEQWNECIRRDGSHEELDGLLERAKELAAHGPARSLGFLIAVTTLYLVIGGGIATFFGAATWGLADYILGGHAETVGHGILVFAGLALTLWMCCLCGYTTIREIRRDWARFSRPSWWPVRSRVG